MTGLVDLDAPLPGVVVVFVPGHPKPAGSKRVFMVAKAGAAPRPVVTDDSGAKGRDWRASIQHAIAAVFQGPPLTGPLELSCYFTVARPRGHSGKRGLLPSAPSYPTTRPDITKLLRAVEDAATGLLWADDAQIVTQSAAKRYGARPGVVIHCRPLSGAPEGEEP
ncbi:MAG TPA: RusA family crossover junction endodeoxyribonuclease [Gaiellales bacterium]|nr:RusA family crossover junction endodeoxyribonuclease [Gaiellales bacterium]